MCFFSELLSDSKETFGLRIIDDLDDLDPERKVK